MKKRNTIVDLKLVFSKSSPFIFAFIFFTFGSILLSRTTLASSTLFTVHFDNSLETEDGELPETFGPVQYNPGKINNGVLVEDSTTNLLLNPSAEGTTDEWGNRPGVTHEFQNTDVPAYQGSYVMKLDSSGATSWPYISKSFVAKDKTAYTFCVYARVASGSQEGFKVAVSANGDINKQNNSSPITLTTEWQRVCVTNWISYFPSNTRGVLQIYANSNWTGKAVVYIDAMQLEEGPVPTSYTDGSLGQGYSWNLQPPYFVLLSKPTQSALATSTDSGSLPAGTYYYRVTALSANGETDVSNERSATLSAPGTITVSWGAISGATGYNVYGTLANETSNNEQLIATVGPVTNYDDDAPRTPLGAMPIDNTANTAIQSNTGGSLLGGTSYQYALAANNTNGNTDIQSIITVPIAAGTDTNQTTIYWDASAEATGYLLYRKLTTDSLWKRIELAAVTEYNDTNGSWLGADYELPTQNTASGATADNSRSVKIGNFLNYTTEGNIDKSRGRITLWTKFDGFESQDQVLFQTGDLILKRTADGYISFSDGTNALKHKVASYYTVVLNFDDGYDSAYNSAKPVLDSFGYKGVVYVITGNVGTSGYVTQAQLEELHNAGWDIASHSVTHPSLGGASEETIRSELSVSKDYLETYAFTYQYFALPYGFLADFREPVYSIAKEYYSTNRSAFWGFDDNAPEDDYRLLTEQATTQIPFFMVQRYIDIAQDNNRIVNILIHGVDSGYAYITSEQLSQYLQYMQDNDVAVGTMSQVYANSSDWIRRDTLTQISVSWGDGNMNLYIDGNLEQTTTYTEPASLGERMYIGSGIDGSSPLQGLIDEFQIDDNISDDDTLPMTGNQSSIALMYLGFGIVILFISRRLHRKLST